MIFTGRFEYGIDDKGRLSIPSRLRDQITRDGQALSLYITRGPKGQLMAYAEKEYAMVTEVLGGREDAQAAEVLRDFTKHTEEHPIDKQGRIVLAPRLRELAGIGREAVVIGAGKRIEVWDKARLEKYEQEGAARIEGAMAALKGRADLWG